MPVRWRRASAEAAGLAAILLCLIPPTGVLSDNEEDYFGLAAHLFSIGAPPPFSALFDASLHRILNDLLLGGLIAALGFPATQVVVRLLIVVGYAFALRALFRRFHFSVLESALVVIVFAELGQGLMGGEWLFGDAEAKAVAYICVLGGLATMAGGRDLRRPALLFAIATYFHFLVGGFWFVAAMLWRRLDDPGAGREIVKATALYSVAMLPLGGVMLWSRLVATTAAVPADMPTADIIYSVIRAPHHTAPFLDWKTFRDQWLPGHLSAGAMLAGCVMIARAEEDARRRALALWLGFLLAYLIAVLIPVALDRQTALLGKFYLFRPASLTLLLWLALVLAFVNHLGMRRATFVKSLALILTLPSFLLAAAFRVDLDLEDRSALVAEKTALADYLATHAAGDALVLLDPEIEFSYLDFERRSGHPMLVAWKFMPTNDREIYEWYRRILFRRTVFEQGCREARQSYPVALLVTTPEHAAGLAASCGPVVYRTDRVAIIRNDR